MTEQPCNDPASDADPGLRYRASSFARYLFAIAAVLVVLVLTGWLHRYFQATPNAFFFCAIILAGWFGGLGPGLLASILSVAVIKYYFTPPGHSLAVPMEEAPRWLILLLAGAFISWVCHQQRRDERALIKARRELEEKVRARTRAYTDANERLRTEVLERTAAECELQRLNRAWRVRSACNRAVTRCTDESELMQEVCETIVVEGGYRLAWVGYAAHDEMKSIRPVARAGEAKAYLDNIVATWGEGELGQGPAAVAIRTVKPAICNEITTDPRLVPWRERAMANGLRSSVALPLTTDSNAFGVLMAYSEEPEAFDEKESELLGLAAAELSYGLTLLRSRTERQAARDALKRTEEELSRVSRVTAMGELTASIAHEVNQPLGAVVTNGNAALRWLSADPPNMLEVREALERIVRDGNRAGDVIARIRGLLNKSEPETQPVDVNELIREIASLTHGEAERRGAALETDLSSALPQVIGDRVQLQQLLLNLVINALEAMNSSNGAAHVVKIRSAPVDADHVQVSVSDTGIGLKPEQAEHLFDAFYTTKPDGLGMGLSISRSIVEAHGGKLWAEPNAASGNGPGATFRFTLPTQA